MTSAEHDEDADCGDSGVESSQTPVGGGLAALTALGADTQHLLRSLPSVSALLARADVSELVLSHGRSAVIYAVRSALAEARRELRSGRLASVSEAEVERHLAQTVNGSLRTVLNATGVVLHTNLGRAPLARQAIEALALVASGYATVEYDLQTGRRGERASHAVELLSELTGAEAALVVNNNAAAVLLALSVWASGREVIVSRGELVEIGGRFRIPDVLRQSGARLVEVGTTNRTRAEDYLGAISSETALLFKVHRSNFDLVGFTSEVGVRQLSMLAHDKGLPLFYDAGSGNLLAELAPFGEAPVSTHILAGADLVMFSGDKLLGGPQAGIIVGRRKWLAPMLEHPLLRALRPDKLCLAALRATLLSLRDAPHEVPVVRMLVTPLSELEERSLAMAREIRRGGYENVTVVPALGRIGGGAAPSRELETRAIRLDGRDPGALCRALRAGDPPVIARIEDGATLLDLRCIPAALDPVLTQAVLTSLSR